MRHSRELGFSLDAIRGLIDLAQHPERTCADADRFAADHSRDVEAKIEQLTRLKRELERMIDHCAGGTVGTCRAIETLADHTLCEGANA